VEIDLQAVTRREQGMSAYEVMLSESQERMLVVVRPSAEEAARKVIERFELHADRIGKITEKCSIIVRDGASVVADLALEVLVDGVPLRNPGSRPQRIRSEEVQPEIEDPERVLLELLATPNLRSRRAVFRTYDHQVQNNTVIGPGFDAALLRVSGTDKGLALTTDCNSALVEVDPYQGTLAAVAEAARNLVCTGARPLAVTNCLNFGNPERPHIFWQLEESVRGLGDACRAFGLPVVSGNVSLYNETSGRNIPPTPVIGMVGLLDNLEHRCPAGFQEAGDVVILFGETQDTLAGSQFARLNGPGGGQPPSVDLEAEKRLQEMILEAAANRLLQSAHDVSDGGLLIGLAEACLFGGLGFRCASITGMAAKAALYFGESSGRIIASCKPAQVEELQKRAANRRVPMQVLGIVSKEEFQVGSEIRMKVDRLREKWETPW
jgi:phosphoribosylformylglycinamidine synthase